MVVLCPPRGLLSLTIPWGSTTHQALNSTFMPLREGPSLLLAKVPDMSGRIGIFSFYLDLNKS